MNKFCSPDVLCTLREYFLKKTSGLLFVCFGDNTDPKVLNPQAQVFMNLEKEFLKETIEVLTITFYDDEYAIDIEKEYIHPDVAKEETRISLGMSEEMCACMEEYLTNFYSYLFFYS